MLKVTNHWWSKMTIKNRPRYTYVIDISWYFWSKWLLIKWHISTSKRFILAVVVIFTIVLTSPKKAANKQDPPPPTKNYTYKCRGKIRRNKKSWSAGKLLKNKTHGWSTYPPPNVPPPRNIRPWPYSAIISEGGYQLRVDQPSTKRTEVGSGWSYSLSHCLLLPRGIESRVPDQRFIGGQNPLEERIVDLAVGEF